MVYFFNHIDMFLMIIVRLLGFFIIFPLLSGGNIPMMSRILLALSMAYMVFSSTLIIPVEYYPTVLGFGVLVVSEFLVGFLMAYVVYVVFTVVQLAGQMIDMQLGFAMARAMDPLTQMQTPLTGNLLFMVMMLMMVQTGGLHAFISALFFSYDVLPLGQAVILNNGAILNGMVQLMAVYFVTAVQIGLPLVGSLLVVTIALGMLVKAAPQMNIFVVGLPLKLLIGFVLLYVTMPVFAYVYDLLFSQATRAVINMIRDLSP